MKLRILASFISLVCFSILLYPAIAMKRGSLTRGAFDEEEVKLTPSSFLPFAEEAMGVAKNNPLSYQNDGQEKENVFYRDQRDDDWVSYLENQDIPQENRENPTDTYKVRFIVINTKTPKKLDLHGVSSVSLARDKTLEFITAARAKNKEKVEVITGRGNHLNRDGKRGTLFQSLPQWIEWNPLIKGHEAINKSGAYTLYLQPIFKIYQSDKYRDAITKYDKRLLEKQILRQKEGVSLCDYHLQREKVHRRQKAKNASTRRFVSHMIKKNLDSLHHPQKNLISEEWSSFTLSSIPEKKWEVFEEEKTETRSSKKKEPFKKSQKTSGSGGIRLRDFLTKDQAQLLCPPQEQTNKSSRRLHDTKKDIPVHKAKSKLPSQNSRSSATQPSKNASSKQSKPRKLPQHSSTSSQSKFYYTCKK